MSPRLRWFLFGTTSHRAIHVMLPRDDEALKRALIISGRMLGTIKFKPRH